MYLSTSTQHPSISSWLSSTRKPRGIAPITGRLAGSNSPSSAPCRSFGLTTRAGMPTAVNASGASSVNATGDSSSMSSDGLLIVGPGVLGSRLGSLWLAAHPGATVVGQTNTTNNHGFLSSVGIVPRVGPTAEKFAHVAFCAPPSGSEDYAGDVARALDMWDGTGNFVFTSSAGVYDVKDGSACREDSPTVAMGASPRTDVLLAAEQSALSAGGNVVRLVGLYHRTRGAHTFFLKQGTVQRPGSYMVNLIHYEDAARLCAAVLGGEGPGAAGGRYRGQVFVGCDDRPVSFEDMMASIERAGLAGLEGHVTFSAGEAGGTDAGKRMGNEKTRETLGWTPKHKSVEDFFERDGEDWWFELAQGGVHLGMPHKD